MQCNICPRRCNIDRNRNLGMCGVGMHPKVAKAYLHEWEEPCLSAMKGSGTVFFSGCNLKCVYCQNHEISHKGYGKYITHERLAEIFRELESKGATNINLVSPTHYVDAIKKALDIYRPNIPIVYNSSGYDSLECLDVLKCYVDIYLVDFKYYDSGLSSRLSKAPDYAEVAKVAISKMREHIPNNIYDGDVMKKGVIIRHLILPNHTDDSINILKWIKGNISEPCISLMGQYTPMYQADRHKDISRKLKPLEYKLVAKAMLDMGLDDGYFQELSSATDAYTPDWDLDGVE